MTKEANRIADISPPEMGTAQRHSRSFWRDALAFILRDRLTMFAVSVLLVATLICSLIAGGDLREFSISMSTPPVFLIASSFPAKMVMFLGTDQLGRDQFLRLIYGGRVSLTIAYLASTFTVFIGITLGLLAGYYGRQVDDLDLLGHQHAQRHTAALLAFDRLGRLGAIEPKCWSSCWRRWAGWGRAAWCAAKCMSLKERDYVLAARALGASDLRILIFAYFAQRLLNSHGHHDHHRRQSDH